MFSHGVITLSGGKWMKIDGVTFDFVLHWNVHWNEWGAGGRRLPRPLEQKRQIQSKIRDDRNVDNSLFYIPTDFGEVKLKIDGVTFDFVLHWNEHWNGAGGRRLPRPLEQKRQIQSKIRDDRNVDNSLFYIATNFGEVKLKNQGARAKRAGARG